ncbi:MAG: hypothetical protein K2W96_02350 [Gemmataceae bacterium]|nr:hypothetical protein [Gemmataceae bacterium]
MPAPIPEQPEEPLVNRYREYARLCGLLALASVVLAGAATGAILALASEEALVVIPLILGGAGLLGTVICAIVFACHAPMVDRHLDEFRRGEYLARWTYQPGEWARFAEDERRGKEWLAGLFFYLFAGIGLILGAVLWWTTETVIAFIACAGGGALLGGIIALIVLRVGQAAYRRAQRMVGVTCIGPQAAYFNGTYHCWATFGIRLLGVDLHQGGESTVLTLNYGMDSEANSTLRLLVPAGKEDEARELVRRLR